MSYSEYLTKVSLIGAKASVLKMLNTAIKNVGGGKALTAEDSIETIVDRFFNKDDKSARLRFLIHDFLDMESIDDTVMKQRRDDFREEFGENNSYEYSVVILNVTDKGDEYEVELRLAEDEYDFMHDWAGWADLTEVYGVKIYEDLYDYGFYPGYTRTTIHELEDGALKTTEIEPSLDTAGFHEGFNTLIDLHPRRYKSVLVETLENEIEQLQETVRRYKLSIIKDNLKENGGHAKIPEGWAEIEAYAFKNCKELKSITLPASLKAIGTQAFEGCENLWEITIPSSVESIGYCAFKDCPCAEGMDESSWKERTTEEDDAWINEILG